MSWYSSHRSTHLQRAVSRALLYSVGYAVLSSSTQAATIGKTVISSPQHKPLFASISVTDIQNSDFSVDMASTTIYQQMGMTPTDSMSVNFVPTSATTGQLIISTTQPVSKPFADLVLALNDGDQRTVIPKTLLMPLSDSLPIKAASNDLNNNLNNQALNNAALTAQATNTRASNTTISGAKRPNLPVTSLTNAKPLTLRAGMPPPLLSNARVPLSASVAANNQTMAQTNQISSDNLTSKQIDTAPNTINLTQSSVERSIVVSNQQSSPLMTTPLPVVTDKKTPSTKEVAQNQPSTPINVSTARDLNKNNLNAIAAPIVLKTSDNIATNPLLDTLSIQVTRQIQLTIADSIAASSASTSLDAPLASLPNSDTVSSSTAQVQLTAKAPQTSNAIPTGTSYTVQPNDNLWVISQQIAQQNNLNIKTVMAKIKAQNPNAFLNKDAGQLRADAQLNLSEYDVVPSQQKLKAAIDEQRRYVRQSSTIDKEPSKPDIKRVEAARRQSQTATIKQLPKARFSVIAPGVDGNADGTQTEARAKTGNGLNTDILSTLKATRQSTATQAKSLVDTNSTLESYTQKIQLQNQKLAELQARLKELRDQ